MSFGTATRSGNRIQVHGLRDLSRELTAWRDKDLNKEFANDLKRAAEPVARRAGQIAPNRSGTFAGSYKIAGGRSGVFLRSTDPEGPYKEFQQHTPQGRGLTALHGPPARSSFPAIEDEADGVVRDLEAAVTRVLQQTFARYS